MSRKTHEKGTGVGVERIRMKVTILSTQFHLWFFVSELSLFTISRKRRGEIA